MDLQRRGLFALQVGAIDLASPKQPPAGHYDPVEQLWRDEGIVLAFNCQALGLQGTCELPSECVLGIKFRGKCPNPEQICCLLQ
jgi:hypothetical protein